MSTKDGEYWLASFLANIEEEEKWKLSPAEKEFADSLLSIAAKYGKLADGDENGIWVGYEGPEENDDAAIGVKCSNCYLHESEVVCKIAKVVIHPEGKCRLAVIPPGMVSMNDDDSKDDDSYDD